MASNFAGYMLILQCYCLDGFALESVERGFKLVWESPLCPV